MSIQSSEQPHSLEKLPNERSAKVDAPQDAEREIDSVEEKEISMDDNFGEPAKRDWRFWTIIGTLSVMGILSSLENTVVVTSLPVMVEDLSLGESYIWITNIFFLTG